MLSLPFCRITAAAFWIILLLWKITAAMESAPFFFNILNPLSGISRDFYSNRKIPTTRKVPPNIPSVVNAWIFMSGTAQFLPESVHPYSAFPIGFSSSPFGIRKNFRRKLCRNRFLLKLFIPIFAAYTAVWSARKLIKHRFVFRPEKFLWANRVEGE